MNEVETSPEVSSTVSLDTTRAVNQETQVKAFATNWKEKLKFVLVRLLKLALQQCETTIKSMNRREQSETTAATGRACKTTLRNLHTYLYHLVGREVLAVLVWDVLGDLINVFKLVSYLYKPSLLMPRSTDMADILTIVLKDIKGCLGAN